MAIGTVVGFSGSPGSTQNATPTATLPTITAAGYAVALIGTNAGSTTAVNTPPSGWALLDGPYNNGSNNMRIWLYGKAVTSADSGATFSATLSLTSRWAVGGAVLPGASGVDVTAQWLDDTDDLNISIPAITPGVDDTYRIVLVYDRSVSGALTVTPPGSWTELADVCSTNGSGARFGAWVGGIQLVGQSGVAQATASATYSTNARNDGWQLTIAPTATSESHSGSAALTGSGVLSVAAAVAVSAAVALSGSGGLATTGTPALARTAALSGSGTLATTGTPATSRAVTLSGAGTLSAAGTPAATAAVALSGTGTLAATGTGSEAGGATVALSGSGTLAATTQAHTTATTALSGAGTLTATGSSSEAGGASVSLTGSGTLTTTGRPAVTITVALTGSGSLTATAVPALTFPAALTGDGTLAATGVASQAGDGTPVASPALALTVPASLLVLDNPATAVTLTTTPAALTLTVPTSTLEIT